MKPPRLASCPSCGFESCCCDLPPVVTGPQGLPARPEPQQLPHCERCAKMIQDLQDICQRLAIANAVLRDKLGEELPLPF